MCIQEYRSSVCQTINMRCLHLRMTAQTTDPVVLVINGNKQNVGFASVLRSSRSQKETAGKQQ